MDKKASLKDIAQKVGVSTALVSYVLNNKRENRVSPEIAQKIRETAAQLNYRTNQIARSLKTNKTNTIGLIVADIANPFSSMLARIIEDEADKYGYTVIFSSSDENKQKSAKLIDTLVDRQVDGLIIFPPAFSEEQIMALKEQQVPFVLIDRYFPHVPANYVALDNYGAAYKGVEQLIGDGCKRIGMITYDTNLFHLLERKRGYAAALKQYKLPALRNMVKEIPIHYDVRMIQKAVDALLRDRDPVDGLLFSANNLAIEGMKYLSTLPVKIPGQLRIVCFDETETLKFFHAPFTYIQQPLQEMGRLATRILLEAMEKKNGVTTVNLEGTLVRQVPFPKA